MPLRKHDIEDAIRMVRYYGAQVTTVPVPPDDDYLLDWVWDNVLFPLSNCFGMGTRDKMLARISRVHLLKHIAILEQRRIEMNP